MDVPGLTSGVAQISVSVQHFCALTTAGAVKCRGANQFGQLGDGDNCGYFCNSVVDVIGLSSGVASIATGVNHTCAIMTSGQAKCWGLNVFGGLGDGNYYRERSVPADVVASVVKSPPTPVAPTPCGPAGCPTATATPVIPLTGVDFSLAVDANGDTVDDCQTRPPGPATCNLQLDAPFNLKVRLNALAPHITQYAGMDIKIPFSGVTSAGQLLWVWPECLFSGSLFDPSYSHFGCGTAGESNYLGVLARTVMNCTASGTVSMEHGFPNTSLVRGHDLSSFGETVGIGDQLTINCLQSPPTFPPTPTSTPTPNAVGGLAIESGTEGAGGAGWWWPLVAGLVVALACAATVVAVRRR